MSIVGGIQPSTIEHLISGDESQEDGLWNRFMFTRLPQTRIDAFSHTPYSLTEHLETLYRSLASQESFRHFLSEESKPLWADWHVWTEDKTFSESSWIARGTYAKIEGIAARNALIIHRTMAAIAGVIPDLQISASTMAIAIDWTKWELSQTLLEYQMLGLTNDPEQSRILKFIDKFSGKGWVSARDVDRWWSARTKPPANELREFMAKVVKLGQAIDNNEAIESSKYRIQISSNGSDSSDKNSVNVAEKQTRLSLPLVTNLSPKAVKHSHNGDSEFVTTTRSIGSDKSENRQDIQTEINADEFVTNFATNGSDKPETSLNGHHSQQSTNFVTKGSDSVNSIYDNQFSDSVTTVTTDSNKNIFKIGDYAKAGDDIVVITEVKEDYISGLDKDKNPIGGHPNSFTIASAEKFAATQGELDDEWN